MKRERSEVAVFKVKGTKKVTHRLCLNPVKEGRVGRTRRTAFYTAGP